jgi:uncharacterized membrane protein
LSDPVPRATPKQIPTVRRELPVSQAFQWLQLGWGDLKASGKPSLFYGVCFSVVGALLLIALGNAVHMVTAVTTGFMLVGPFFAIGLYELSRRRECGEPLELLPTLAVWRRNMPAIGTFSLILIVLYLVWARASLVVFALFYEGGMPTMEGFFRELLKFNNLEFLIAYLAVGGLFAGLVFAFSVVSIPLMLDRNQDTVTAMLASFMALVQNFPTMIVWGALIAGLTLLGFATALLGLIVTMPLVGHATWHAYRALIAPDK